MAYIVVRSINDLLVQTRKSELSDAVASAEELIKGGIETHLVVCKEIETKEADHWNYEIVKRVHVCSVS